MIRISLGHRIIGFVLIMAIGMGVLPFTLAQENGPATVTISGTVEAINGTTLVVSGVNVDFSASNINISDLQVGVVVQITGTFANGIIIATTIVVVNPAPEVTAAPTEESTAEVTPSPTEAGGDDTLIVIEGPVQQINLNIITILNFNIQVAADDPILTQIQVGDNVRVEGHAVPQGNTIIIIVVNITIVNVVIVNPGAGNPGQPSNCRITPGGHIKCTRRHH
jgi:uncharacterized protein DUF5666